MNLLDVVVVGVAPVHRAAAVVQRQPVGPQHVGGDENAAVGSVHPGLFYPPYAVVDLIFLPVCPVHPATTHRIEHIQCQQRDKANSVTASVASVDHNLLSLTLITPHIQTKQFISAVCSPFIFALTFWHADVKWFCSLLPLQAASCFDYLSIRRCDSICKLLSKWSISCHSVFRGLLRVPMGRLRHWLFLMQFDSCREHYREHKLYWQTHYKSIYPLPVFIDFFLLFVTLACFRSNKS